MHGRKGTHYYVFDLLHLDGRDMREPSLVTRKAELATLLARIDVDLVRYTDHVVGASKAFVDVVRGAGLEGVVAKRRNSTYSGALMDDWLKIKMPPGHITSFSGAGPHAYPAVSTDS